MSKELEALKRIRQETCPCTYNPDFDKDECCNIIETALKDYERVKTSYLENLLNEESKEYIYKKLKALEIIKEKNVDVTTLLDCLNAKEYNRWVPIRSHYTYRPFEIAQEEYDLLKEVLL